MTKTEKMLFKQLGKLEHSITNSAEYNKQEAILTGMLIAVKEYFPSVILDDFNNELEKVEYLFNPCPF
ncbi:hypothetical protein I6M86_05705 [Citrobacter cronae]|uniref:hypothetical protein n=1 Tax=Citrobacter TaxID=544 RepID=UPI00136FA28A|nr:MULTISPECIES: hypothetical protein [Citrobacter]MBJ8376040.1 hypothetical protein [Citrobacter cronae]MYL96134.1 hypothetical protein [Citrobacter werkmanii]UBX42930.1 hypothetical protein LD024_13185 [Citrobacter werkmanii]